MPILKSAWKDSVWSQIIAAGIVALAGTIGTYLLGYWPVIKNGVAASWNFMFASTLVANWLLGLIGLVSIPLFLIFVLAIWESKGDKTPNWRNYTSDMFFNLRWRWRYAAGHIESLATYCPHCDYQIFPQEVGAYNFARRLGYSCDSCRRNLTELDETIHSLESKVERFIQQKIRNQSWHSKAESS